ncbi:CATRA system-associated protein [Catellatospora sp. NPDC049111]|uniref:CATRA system-associated protein n=1 Tax=Catellatospora sp. NPDC049111 TaxID=3155271 RepID=UPI0033F27331
MDNADQAVTKAVLLLGRLPLWQLSVPAWAQVEQQLDRLAGALDRHDRAEVDAAVLGLETIVGHRRQEASARRPASANAPTAPPKVAAPERLKRLSALLLERLIVWRW